MKLNVELEPGWRIVELRHNPGQFLCTIVISNTAGKTWEAGYDLQKGIFITTLPITIDASLIRNILRSIMQ